MRTAISLLTLVFLLFAGMITAQPGRGQNQNLSPEQQAERMTLHMTRHFSLTADQQVQVKAINLDFVQKRLALRDNPSPEARQALRDEHHAALVAVFTDEQEKLMGEFRQGPPGRHGFCAACPLDKADRQAMRTERMTYRQENILPVLAAQRAKLEPKITPADQALIAALRDKLQTCTQTCLQNGNPRTCQGQGQPAPGNQQNQQNKRQGKQNQGPGNPPNQGCGPQQHGGHGFGPEGMGMRMLLNDETTRQQAEQLVATYGPDIDVLFAEIATKREQWQQDMQAICQQYCPQNCTGNGPGANSPGKGPGAGPDDFHRKLHFLLMSPDLPENSQGKATTARAISLYPNPATAQQQIEFDVLAAGNVRVEIVDRQGKVVRTVFSGTLEAGVNRLEVNTGDLPRGQLYYYRITDGKGTSSKAFMVRE